MEAQGNNHPGFVHGHHLMLVNDFRAVKLGLSLNNLHNSFEGQKVSICHHLTSM